MPLATRHSLPATLARDDVNLARQSETPHPFTSRRSTSPTVSYVEPRTPCLAASKPLPNVTPLVTDKFAQFSPPTVLPPVQSHCQYEYCTGACVSANSDRIYSRTRGTRTPSFQTCRPTQARTSPASTGRTSTPTGRPRLYPPTPETIRGSSTHSPPSPSPAVAAAALAWGARQRARAARTAQLPMASSRLPGHKFSAVPVRPKITLVHTCGRFHCFFLREVACSRRRSARGEGGVVSVLGLGSEGAGRLAWVVPISASSVGTCDALSSCPVHEVGHAVSCVRSGRERGRVEMMAAADHQFLQPSV